MKYDHSRDDPAKKKKKHARAHALTRIEVVVFVRTIFSRKKKIGNKKKNKKTSEELEKEVEQGHAQPCRTAVFFKPDLKN